MSPHKPTRGLKCVRRSIASHIKVRFARWEVDLAPNPTCSVPGSLPRRSPHIRLPDFYAVPSGDIATDPRHPPALTGPSSGESRAVPARRCATATPTPVVEHFDDFR